VAVFWVVFLRSTKRTLTKVAYLSNVCYHTPFQDPTLSGVSVARTSEVRVSAMLVLRNVENQKIRVLSGL
jgi:hypothetical protein